MINVRFHNPHAEISMVGSNQLQGHCALCSHCREILPCLPKSRPAHPFLIAAPSLHLSGDGPMRPPTPHLLNDWSVMKTPIQASL